MHIQICLERCNWAYKNGEIELLGDTSKSSWER